MTRAARYHSETIEKGSDKRRRISIVEKKLEKTEELHRNFGNFHPLFSPLMMLNGGLNERQRGFAHFSETKYHFEQIMSERTSKFEPSNRVMCAVKEF